MVKDQRLLRAVSVASAAIEFGVVGASNSNFGKSVSPPGNLSSSSTVFSRRLSLSPSLASCLAMSLVVAMTLPDQYFQYFN